MNMFIKFLKLKKDPRCQMLILVKSEKLIVKSVELYCFMNYGNLPSSIHNYSGLIEGNV